MTCNKVSPIELAVIIPTYNEKDNIILLLEKLDVVLSKTAYEIIVVDDNSPDGTWNVVSKAAIKTPEIRCIRRIGRKGLSSACIEGMLSSTAPFLAVMDADLQHDETILPFMLEELKRGGLDIVLGSRYVNGGGMEGWAKSRIFASRAATDFAKAVTGISVQDPMSGFFMVRREYFESVVTRLNSRGFKILLDLLMSSHVPPRFKEIPYQFRLRHYGTSKLSVKVIMDYFMLVLQKGLQRRINLSKQISP
ncbi:MAG: hypothetical protein A2293_09195 [Elusimicrobia bacterium RIFOXYB2_FULL_49_7]|nr:MAG: hypothetical protein A2293_09195 [Elusimicrobia bacterium RIFOXYB2_FULL_49_7]